MARTPISPAPGNKPRWSVADAAVLRASGLVRGVVLGSLLGLAVPVTAQPQEPALPAPAAAPAPAASLDPAMAGLRAANVARKHAERLNGGLGVYRPQACMYSNRGAACLIRRDSEGFLFRFLGGPPGWQQLSLPASVETEILISPDGTQVERVLFNGPPRAGATGAP